MVPLLTGAENLSFSESLVRLKGSIDSYHSPRGRTADIFKNYLDQNIKLTPEEISDSITILRNYKMAEKIDSILNIKSAFIAIGAGHLPYKDGVLNLLSEKGYGIKPYKINLRKKK